ncbi:MAG: hypothetical protein E6L09_13965 [Verrucomicrobia bacterium]|nr:MAG: hypothetical protein E6L09_13965 [Verrucomicrobiota bacterium]
MACCLVQTDFAVPSAEQLTRAFRSLETLTGADAVKLANEACGILAKNLSPQDASRLQGALAAEGVPSEIVDAARLPRLPDVKFVRRLELHPQALLIYDPLGRTVPVPWQHVALIAAGSVRHFGVTTTRTEETLKTFDPIRGFRTKVVTDRRHKIEEDTRLLLGIFLTGGTIRFEIEAEAFMFKYCFDRPDLNLAQKLGLLIQMLAQNAPQALMNRGAVALRDGATGSATHASKAALFDECAWWLWQMIRKNRESG